MGVHEGSGQLAKSLKTLLQKWQEARMGWDDARAKEFEEQYIRPLERDLRTATTAMDQASQALNTVRRDCT